LSHKPYRYAFGDEVGDTGLTATEGTSRFFMAVVVLLDDPAPISERIDRLRRELGLPGHVEFKFHRTSDSYRRSFLAALEPYGFVVRALYVEKSTLPTSFQQMKSREFYAFYFNELFQRIPTDELGQTILVLDQFGGARSTRRELRKRVREKDGQVLFFRKVSLKRSRGDNLLQVADMIGGAIFRELTEGDSSFLDLVRNKVRVWRFEVKENPPS
jgi:hypothetical protein